MLYATLPKKTYQKTKKPPTLSTFAYVDSTVNHVLFLGDLFLILLAHPAS